MEKRPGKFPENGAQFRGESFVHFANSIYYGTML
jgi:hypothetical protein